MLEEALLLQKERAKIYEGAKVDIKKKRERQQGQIPSGCRAAARGMGGNLEEQVERARGTVSEYIQSNAGSPVSPGATMTGKPQVKLPLCQGEILFSPRNVKSMSLQIFSPWYVQLERWKSIPKCRQSPNI